ncbi:MAG: hypothetical protein AAF420_14825 [Pseudomonadota bacterium]
MCFDLGPQQALVDWGNKMKLKWVWSVLFVMSWATFSSAGADEYPEFAGVYVKVHGKFIEVPKIEPAGRVTIYEHTKKLYRTLAAGQSKWLDKYTAVSDERFAFVENDRLRVSPTLPGPIESIFVRSRVPAENVFYEMLAPLVEFSRQTSFGENWQGTYLNPVKGSNPHRKENMFPRTAPAHSKMSAFTNCGYATHHFNVRFVDATATEFVAKKQFFAFRAPYVGRCGKAGSIRTKTMSITVGGAYYVVHLK